MRTAASLRDRAAGYFVAPRAPAELGDRLPAPRTITPPPARRAARVAVLGSAADAPPVAGALANALRYSDGVPAAAVAVWAPLVAPADVTPALIVVEATPGATAEARSAAPAAPAAARLAARLTLRGLPATARGRLAWLRLAEHPVAAALAARRVSGALEMPFVVALAGARTDVLEGLLREQDLVVVVTREPDGALARLATSACEVAAVACAPLPRGPARLLALAGLAGARALDEPLRSALTSLAPAPPAVPAELPPAAVDPARADW